MRYLAPIMSAVMLLAVVPAGAGQYDAVDAHAQAAPASAVRSIKLLGLYLAAAADSDQERARAVFWWIARNIAYDPTCVGERVDPERVLRSRRGVCAGFAALFRSLAEAAGLEAAVIQGEAKGRGPAAARGRDGLLNHDWNAVKINGEWQLVDCAWGAGFLDERGRFVRRFTQHYFLTPPDLFIYDHLPQEPRWQLLSPPRSRQSFLEQVEALPPFFEHGLRLVTHLVGRVDADDRLTIVVAAPQDVSLMASLRSGSAELGDGHTFAQPEREGYEIQALFPSAGDYVLQVHVRRRGASDNRYECALEYKVHASRGASTIFPKVYLSFQEEACHLDGPLPGLLKAGGKVQFRLRAPEAEEVLVASGERQVIARLGSEGGGVFSGSVEAKPGTLTVFAKFPRQRRHVGLLQYAVR